MPGERIEIAELLDPVGAVAGLLLQLARGATLDALARILVADQPGGQFEAAPAQRHAILLDQQ